MNAVSPNKTRSANYLQSPESFTGHHLDSQRLNMSSPVVLGGGPEKTTVSDIVFAKAHRLHINLSDLRPPTTKPGAVAAHVNYDVTVFTFSFSQQLQFRFDVAGSGPWNTNVNQHLVGSWCLFLAQ